MSFSLLSGARAQFVEVAAQASSGSSRGFHASAQLAESHARVTARRKRAKVLAKRAAIAQESASKHADPILGHPLESAASSSTSQSLYPGSRLQRSVLRAQDVWYAAPPAYASGGLPRHYLPGISQADRDLLFGAVPHTSTALAYDPQHPAASAAIADDQAHQSEALHRILDLRNASKRGIEVANRARIIEVFGGNAVERAQQGKGLDTGSSEVQAALLTHKIRSLYEHLQTNTRDIQNQRALRLLVHQRARILKYFKKQSNEEKYDALLADLGLSRSAVEGEIKLKI